VFFFSEICLFRILETIAELSGGDKYREGELNYWLEYLRVYNAQLTQLCVTTLDYIQQQLQLSLSRGRRG